MEFDVVTIGSATQDVFLISKIFRPIELDNIDYNLLPYGIKLDVEDIIYDIGGGATNAAVTFSRAGLRVACMTKVGLDGPGREIEHVLKKDGINTEFMVKNPKHHTGFTSVLLSPSGDSTMLIHRGAANSYNKKDFRLKDLKTRWLFIGTIAGDLAVLAHLIKWARANNVCVVVNPGALELTKSARLRRILAGVEIVIVNREEMTQLSGKNDPLDSLVVCRSAGMRTVVLTDGPAGAWVLDGSYVYYGGTYKKVKVVDRTGAGDAYGAGFVSSLIRQQTVETAMAYGAANATSVIGYIGAKAGIVRNPVLKKIKIKKTLLGEIYETED